ncbi:UNVERIFIED_CONTAM: hypothetical protein Sindi_2568000 [Sesamum indicum]
MLAQELFNEYNQIRRPPRCAMKVDIRKAYDTMEWDFLFSVLQLFGFPDGFTRWIEECVTTPSFSMGMNGQPHGFFTGARGLRQGDPLSLYLFVLVIEKCKAARIFQLSFVDDVLLFCRANIDSIWVLKSGLNRLATWLGLRLNGVKEEMLAILGFQEGHLPMRKLRNVCEHSFGKAQATVGTQKLHGRRSVNRRKKEGKGSERLVLSTKLSCGKNSAKSFAVTGPLYRWIGYFMGDSRRTLSGRFRSTEGHGDGENCNVYDHRFGHWWNVVLVMEGDFTYGGTRGISWSLSLADSHVDLLPWD